jgi:branched-chain amino acid transport system permease protein
MTAADTSTSRRRGRVVTFERVLLGIAVAVLLVAPAFTSDFFVSFVLTQALLLGIAAASLIFLAAYGGMVSLAQTLLFGVSGFVIGNAVTTGGSKGLNLGLDPWLGVVLGVGITTVLAFVLGAVASRSTGLYFLMITLTFGVIGFYFFGQVTTFSGFGGINQVRAPDFVGTPGQFPERLYFLTLAMSAIVYVLLRYIATTPFGLALQGIRDDHVRMSSMGYNLWVHRTLAFTLAGFVASLAGVLFIWWNRQIDPASIGMGEILALLIIAVIGGINRLEGAWVGAIVFVMVNNYVRDVPGLNQIGLSEARFNTIIGLIFLIIVLLSPDGLIGIGQRIVRLLTPHGWHTSQAPGSDDGSGSSETAGSRSDSGSGSAHTTESN